MRTLLVSLFILIAFCHPGNFPESLAAMYRCETQAGEIIHTDSPAQLEKCVVLSTESSMHSQPLERPIEKHQPLPGSTEPSPSKTEDATHEYSFRDKKQNAPRTETVIVPVIPHGGSLLVSVRLNQTRDVQLILDTGATMTVLSNEVALDLGLIASTDTRLTTVNTAGGQIQVNLSKLSSIHAGTAKAHDIDVAIHDLPDTPSGIDGLLGMSFLKHFLVTLDTNEQRLYLKPRS
ncbi:MAG: retroviral-like aspartic protease family protein [Nitrospirales bacterium]|nr:clan AA aspartic protease [Nitrospira sp.]MDR4502466.1 retroviral-like aspartic protease family protein [Nitrospirales bacterium]